MVHGSRGVEIKRRYCFFRRANAKGKIVARTARLPRARIERLLRINARLRMYLSLPAKVNELRADERERSKNSRARALSPARGSRAVLYRALFGALPGGGNVINGIAWWNWRDSRGTAVPRETASALISVDRRVSRDR